ncbi:MAG: hypothetical protein HXO16_08445 [Prevotella salivae]|nr:hypothetical protein [Segatella salivae]
MTHFIITAIVFALGLIATLYDLFVEDIKIEDEKKRKKKIIKDAIFAIVWAFLLISRIIDILHEP